MTDKTWPEPWTLKPAYGQPHDSSDYSDGDTIGWDLSTGFRLNFTSDPGEPLTFETHFGDADLARGFVKREVTPEQLDELARLLLNLAAKQRQHDRAVTR